MHFYFFCQSCTFAAYSSNSTKYSCTDLSPWHILWSLVCTRSASIFFKLLSHGLHEGSHTPHFRVSGVVQSHIPFGSQSIQPQSQIVDAACFDWESGAPVLYESGYLHQEESQFLRVYTELHFQFPPTHWMNRYQPGSLWWGWLLRQGRQYDQQGLSHTPWG